MNMLPCKRFLLRNEFLCAVMVCFLCGPAWTNEPAVQGCGSAAVDAKAVAAPVKEESCIAKKETGEEWENRWFVKWGLANVHARLQESENEINRQLNGPFSILIPGWDRARTFRDLSNNWGLFDAHLALGRDINPNWSWFVDVGGIIGKVRTKENYLFPLPLNVKVDFGRKLWFVAAGLDWYPWGKPVFDRDPSRNAIMNALRSSRPFLEGAIGFVDAGETATARLKFQHLDPSIKIKQYLHHPTEYISPRIGLETPLGKNDSFVLAAGYLFFDRHETDFNNLSVYMMYEHKF